MADGTGVHFSFHTVQFIDSVVQLKFNSLFHQNSKYLKKIIIVIVIIIQH